MRKNNKVYIDMVADTGSIAGTTAGSMLATLPHAVTFSSVDQATGVAGVDGANADLPLLASKHAFSGTGGDSDKIAIGLYNGNAGTASGLSLGLIATYDLIGY